MKWILLGMSVVLMGLRPPDGPVWHWYGTCSPADTIYLEVRLQHTAVYRTSIPVCALLRENIEPERPQKILEFFFTADARIFGSEFKSFGINRIEGNIWEAGKDPDDIILGVSFENDRRILLNSIHIAKVKDLCQTRMAKGLTVRTFPAGRR